MTTACLQLKRCASFRGRPFPFEWVSPPHWGDRVRDHPDIRPFSCRGFAGISPTLSGMLTKMASDDVCQGIEFRFVCQWAQNCSPAIARVVVNHKKHLARSHLQTITKNPETLRHRLAVACNPCLLFSYCLSGLSGDFQAFHTSLPLACLRCYLSPANVSDIRGKM